MADRESRPPQTRPTTTSPFGSWQTGQKSQFGTRSVLAFTDATGVGADQFLIKVVDSPYTEGRVAMLVAGYEAADTAKAVEYVTMESPSTDVGTDLKKVTATYADVA